MIIEYFHPEDESKAIELLNRKSPRTLPLGGGTILSKTTEDVAVVDLQALKLNYIQEKQGQILVGGTTTLEEMLTYFGKGSAVGESLVIEAGKNIRNMATIGGTLIANHGRSALLTILTALGVDLIWKPGNKRISIDTWLSQRDSDAYGSFISELRLPGQYKIAFESVGRSPLDQPIICCAAVRLTNSRLRIALGGFGSVPTLAYDGDGSGDLSKVVVSKLSASGDEWASATYRCEAGTTLVQRLVSQLAEGK